jgi:hypothetical protein
MTEASGLRPDETDQAILDQIYAALSALDPPPADLDERVRFAIALDNVDFEVSRLREDLMVGSGARSTERTRTITFDSDSLTIMVSIVDILGGLVRLDGWLAPARALRVELRMAGLHPEEPGPSHVVTADDTGRFVFEGVAHGLAQLLVHLAGDGEPDTPAAVITPSLIL